MYVFLCTSSPDTRYLYIKYQDCGICCPASFYLFIYFGDYWWTGVEDVSVGRRTLVVIAASNFTVEISAAALHRSYFHSVDLVP